MLCTYETPESTYAACDGGYPCGKGPPAFCETCDQPFCAKHLKVCTECGRVFCYSIGNERCFGEHSHDQISVVAIELELARGRQIA